MIYIASAATDTYITDIEQLGPMFSIRLFINTSGGMDIRVYHMNYGREMIAIPALGVCGYVDQDEGIEQYLLLDCSCDREIVESVTSALRTVYYFKKNLDIDFQDLMRWEFPDGTIPSTVRELADGLDHIKKAHSYREGDWLPY